MATGEFAMLATTMLTDAFVRPALLVFAETQVSPTTLGGSDLFTSTNNSPWLAVNHVLIVHAILGDPSVHSAMHLLLNAHARRTCKASSATSVCKTILGCLQTNLLDVTHATVIVLEPSMALPDVMSSLASAVVEIRTAAGSVGRCAVLYHRKH